MPRAFATLLLSTLRGVASTDGGFVTALRGALSGAAASNE
jgi:hypothetical protein